MTQVLKYSSTHAHEPARPAARHQPCSAGISSASWLCLYITHLPPYVLIKTDTGATPASGIPIPRRRRRLRVRRLAPHLGQYIHNINNNTMQQAKASHAVQT